MPFSPCGDPESCTDHSVSMLKDIFGPVVDALVRGADPESVQASANILATMFGIYASGIMVVGGFIVSGVALMSVLNTANDGEAMGKDWSSTYTTLRVVTSGGLLLPTASGYSFIQLLVLMIALWGVGFGNLTYKTGMGMSVLSPSGIVSNAAAPGSYYGVRDFAKRYMGAMYCSRVANANYVTASGLAPNVAPGSVQDQKIQKNGLVEYIYHIKDRNLATNLSGGAPICGTVTLSLYNSTSKVDPAEASLETLRANVQKQKIETIQAVMVDIKAFTDSWPTSVEEDGWEKVDSRTFNEIVKKHEDLIAVNLMSQLSQQKQTLDSGMDSFLDSLTEGGWAMGGGWFQRVGMARQAVSKIFTEPVASVSDPITTGLPSTEQTRIFLNSVSVIPDLVMLKANEKLSSTEKDNLTATSLKDLIPTNITSAINVSNIEVSFAQKISLLVNSMMEGIVSVATGANQDQTLSWLPCGSAGEIGGSINRMKCIGDYLALQHASLLTADATIKSATTVGRMVLGAASGAKVLGTGAELDKIGTPFWDWVITVPIKWIATLSTYTGVLAFYFGVIIPSFPYTVFMIVFVGWVLSVIQTVVAAPLWMVMHMTPDRTFIGSQTQGYLMLLALFARPALAVLGLFASMLISDPIITYIAKAFFSMHSALAMSTGTVGALASFTTFFWWMILFGMTLMPVLWMTYGLPQVLPDAVLKWISAGIDDLGASQAIPEVRGAHQGAERMINMGNGQRLLPYGRGRGSPSGGNPSPVPGTDGGRMGNRAQSKPLSVNDQGIV